MASVAVAGAAGVVAAVAGAAWGQAIPKRDALGVPCPACDGPHPRLRVARPWSVPARCRDCGRTVRGPVVGLALAGGVVVAGLAAHGAGGALLAARTWLVVVLAGLVWADARHRVLPGRLVWWGVAGSLPLLVAAAAGGGGRGALVRAVVVAIGSWAIVLALHLASPEGLAFGDVRLCLLLGLHLGWGSVLAAAIALVLASALGAAWGLLGPGRSGGGGPPATIPFGPFLAAATVAVLVVSGGG